MAPDSHSGLSPRHATQRDKGPLHKLYDTTVRKMRRNLDTREVALNQQTHIHCLIPLVDSAKRGEPGVRGIVKSLGDVMSLQC